MPGNRPEGRTAARRLFSRLAGLLALLSLVAVPGTIVLDGLAPSRATAAPADDDEGGTASLRDNLEAAAKGYIDANTKLENSKKRQAELDVQLKDVEAKYAAHTVTVGELANVTYRTGRISVVSALLSSESPDNFMARASALNGIAANENKALKTLTTLRAEVDRTRGVLTGEIQEQEKQVKIMAARKKQAERALAAHNSGQAAGGHTSAGSASAKPAPRNSDGSWPAESCSINDPTTSGCITPRMNHALQQAKAAGFTRYVSCHRNGGGGEHPKGRACDFAAQKGGFGGVATGAARTYGNDLAAYFKNNAGRLGVLYVIWFRQIWMPSTGWRSYNGGGDPSSDHTNHVHLSVY